MNRWLHGLAGDRQFLVVILVGKAKQVGLIAAAVIVALLVGLWWLLRVWLVAMWTLTAFAAFMAPFVLARPAVAQQLGTTSQFENGI